MEQDTDGATGNGRPSAVEVNDSMPPADLPHVRITWQEVQPRPPGDGTVYFEEQQWAYPVMYFAGRNGSCKTRAARILAERVHGLYLSADRLMGLMTVHNYVWGTTPNPDRYRGTPLGDAERSEVTQASRNTGIAADVFYTAKDQPQVWIRVAAFLRRALNREVELRESAGFLHPFVRLGDAEYSLIRDEGHGLRELVVLLTAIYRDDWNLLVVDEPELHLHPSLSRLWVSELDRVCRATNRRAVIVTHEPSFIRPKSSDDLGAICYFEAGKTPARIGDYVRGEQASAITADLQQNPELISQLIYSPRPVLVEGVHDIAALTAALNRLEPPEVVAQTDYIRCGGTSGVARWFAIAKDMGLDFRAIADLDACLSSDVQRVMDSQDGVADGYRNELAVEPPTTKTVLRPLIEAMQADNVSRSPKDRARWMAGENLLAGNEIRKKKLLSVWCEAGLWLHPRGTLEDALGIDEKGVNQAAAAAVQSKGLDDAAQWSAYKLDTSGDIELLLNLEVERIAHNIMEALRLDATRSVSSALGSTAEADSKLVKIESLSDGIYRAIINAPAEFAGYWLEFSRDTPANALILKPPD